MAVCLFRSKDIFSLTGNQLSLRSGHRKGCFTIPRLRWFKEDDGRCEGGWLATKEDEMSLVGDDGEKVKQVKQLIC
jgi:hypothetical protein